MAKTVEVQTAFLLGFTLGVVAAPLARPLRRLGERLYEAVAVRTSGITAREVLATVSGAEDSAVPDAPASDFRSDPKLLLICDHCRHPVEPARRTEDPDLLKCSKCGKPVRSPTVRYEVRRPGHRGKLLGVLPVAATVEPELGGGIDFWANSPDEDGMISGWLVKGNRAPCVTVTVKSLRWDLFEGERGPRWVLTTSEPVEAMKRHLARFQALETASHA